MTDKIFKYCLMGLTKEELQNYFLNFGESKFRGSQLFDWIYKFKVSDFDLMTNIKKELRELLKEKCSLSCLELKQVYKSQKSITKKYLFETTDNHKIETVLIPTEERNTLCISTQVGCPLGCKFCATGYLGFKRNLSAGEIIEQLVQVDREQDSDITNIVFMGMGEPLLNYDEVIKTLRIFFDIPGKRFGRNRITLSSVGIPEKIIQLADSEFKIKLAFSLHSCFDEIRSVIAPINKKYPLRENIEALKYYTNKTKTRITFEYVMLENINDREEDVKGLIRLCNQLPSKINLIPFNRINYGDLENLNYNPPSSEKINKFADKLRENNITVMIRATMGDDINAACGQLAGNYEGRLKKMTS